MQPKIKQSIFLIKISKFLKNSSFKITYFTERKHLSSKTSVFLISTLTNFQNLKIIHQSKSHTSIKETTFYPQKTRSKTIQAKIKQKKHRNKTKPSPPASPPCSAPTRISKAPFQSSTPACTTSRGPRK